MLASPGGPTSGPRVLPHPAETQASLEGGDLVQIVRPARQTEPERSASGMLAEELPRHRAHTTATQVAVAAPGTDWPGSDSPVPDQPGTGSCRMIIVLVSRRMVPALLPPALLAEWRALQRTNGKRRAMGRRAEGYSIARLPVQGGSVLVIAGADERGELFGAGWLLRHPEVLGRHARLWVEQAPDKPVRGHQLGYRPKNNTYDGWTLGQFEHQIRDLAIFGANTVQMIAPVSDDAATSPLFPASPLVTLLGVSEILRRYGLDCDLYYPELEKDYGNPTQRAAELARFEALVKAMPRLDALYIPGGDPGGTPPDVLFALVREQAAILRRYHPRATVWVSAQGFDGEGYEQFYQQLRRRPAWLTGVFFGPQSRDALPVQRRRIPARFPVQMYPDIAHTMHAQFPVPRWDPSFALTEGREPICPRPRAFAHIYRVFRRFQAGFVTYSEGINDDVNKIVWTALGWDASTPVREILEQYAAWYLAPDDDGRRAAAAAIAALEENWTGPLPRNPRIAATLAQWTALAQHAQPAGQSGWDRGRWEMLLYRARYDDFLQRKQAREQAAYDSAEQALRGSGTSADRAEASRAALAGTEPGADEAADRAQLFTLADALFRDLRLQLSVFLFGASAVDRGANLDRVDTPLTQATWLRAQLAAIDRLATEPERLAAEGTLVDWAHPVPDALYDDLGEPGNEPHLVRGAGWQRDPELYRTAIDGIADRTPADGWRLSWITYAEALYETELTLRWHGLNRHRLYRVRVTYAGEDYALPLRLVANGRIPVHGPRARSHNPETVDFDLPQAATAGGTLRLTWTRPPGMGGSGRGRQVAEVWLLPLP